MIKIVIYGNPITKKNNQQICYKNAGYKRVPFIIQSKQYRAYEKAFLQSYMINYSKQLEGIVISDAINLKCIYYMQTKRKVDLVNLLEATQDCLVKCGIIADDNSTIIKSVNGSEVLYDKENPRCEIYIEKI